VQLLWPHLLWHQQASSTHQLLPIKTTAITMDIHHHKNQKQKSYNKGYQRGYNKAYKKALKKQYNYYNHTPVYYQPIRRPVVVAPLWRAPRPVIVNPNYYQYSRPHINVGYSFSH